jgi:hypothetical protein
MPVTLGRWEIGGEMRVQREDSPVTEHELVILVRTGNGQERRLDDMLLENLEASLDTYKLRRPGEDVPLGEILVRVHESHGIALDLTGFPAAKTTAAVRWTEPPTIRTGDPRPIDRETRTLGFWLTNQLGRPSVDGSLGRVRMTVEVQR